MEEDKSKREKKRTLFFFKIVFPTHIGLSFWATLLHGFSYSPETELASVAVIQVFRRNEQGSHPHFYPNFVLTSLKLVCEDEKGSLVG